MLTEDKRFFLSQKVSKIIFESKYIPVLTAEAENIDEVRKLDFVLSARVSETGDYQEGEFLGTLVFSPPVTKHALIANQMYGWGGTRIFVLDSGVNDEEVNIVEHKDFTGTGNRDTRCHGTKVARVVKHFAKGASIYSGKIGQIKPEESYLLEALEWAYEKGANIINISAGFQREKINCNGDCELCELVNFFSNKGVLIVVAAGNRDQKIDSIDCPGKASESITVGAVDKNDSIADYSSIGKPGGSKPNLVAPGMVYIDAVEFSGTSFAAPLVVGVLGAVYSKVNNVFDLPKYLYSTLRELEVPSHFQGQGCINIDRFVEVIVNEEINPKSEGQKQGT